MFHPFEDKEEVEKIKKERDDLLRQLESYDMVDSEKRFLIRRIEVITEKLLEKAKYSKKE
jgi:hypothetical protein